MPILLPLVNPKTDHICMTRGLHAVLNMALSDAKQALKNARLVQQVDTYDRVLQGELKLSLQLSLSTNFPYQL
jgi:hypothetical protein